MKSIAELVEEIKQCSESDQEMGHIEADGILCDLLKELGYSEVVDAYNELHKWYA